jgi:hypothetical protein
MKSSYQAIIEEIYRRYPRSGIKVGSGINYKKMVLDTDIISRINDLTSFLPQTASLIERVYCISNNITEIQLCPIQGTPLKFNKATRKYSMKMECIGKLRKKPSTYRYKEVYSGIKDELDKKFSSGEYHFLPKEVVINCFDKIGRTNITPNEIKHNYDLFCSILKHTEFLPYNLTNWSERIYCIKNNIKDIQIDNTNGQPVRFVNRNIGYSKHSNRQSADDKIRNNIIEYIENCGFRFLSFDYRGNQIYKANIQCNTCNTIKKTLTICGHWKSVYCQQCNGIIGRSKAEEEICNFLESNDIQITRNHVGFLNLKELDIYSEQHKIGIEYCGILWHSFGTKYPRNDYREKEKKYNHHLKHSICNSKNIKLLTIFENEWILKKDIVKSIILSKFNKFERKINGRECMFRIITKQEADRFLNDTHLQGSCTSSLHCGLFFNDELVACMTFGSRKITRGSPKFELLRFSTKLNTKIHGGASKLFKNALTYIPNCIITTYSDKRYGSKTFYEQLGFKLIRESLPNYFYTKNCITLENRMKYQKKKLKNFDSYDDNKTETQIMYEEGYRKIYDCGNYVFEYHN